MEWLHMIRALHEPAVGDYDVADAWAYTQAHVPQVAMYHAKTTRCVLKGRWHGVNCGACSYLWSEVHAERGAAVRFAEAPD